MDLLKPSSLRQIFFLVLKRQKYAFSESINRSNQGKVHTDIHMHTVQRAESTRVVKVFSRCVCVYARRHAHGQSRPPFVMPWIVAFQVALSMGFSRQEYWSGLPFPPPDLPNRGLLLCRQIPYVPAMEERVEPNTEAEVFSLLGRLFWIWPFKDLFVSSQIFSK